MDNRIFGIIQFLRNAKDLVDPKVYAAIALLPKEFVHIAIG